MVVLTEVLPSSSTHVFDHHHNLTYDYDVFLSFRGKDTRNGFTDHLYNALLDSGIITFLDDEEIETGEPLKPELESAIRSSRASVIILSNNYASSTWCLDELVLILHQKRICKQYVIPIFYHVEATHVRKLQNSFEEAMADHKQKMEAETDAEKRSQFAKKMESWKMALTQVADLKGRDATGRKETEFIKEVVADIHRRLHVPLSITLPRLIGMDYEIEFISSWLTDGSCHTVDTLTVVGMSGIGKTSLARHVFGLHSSNFDKSSFIEGINARCKENINGMLDLQRQLFGDISKNIPLQVHDVCIYASKIKNALAHKKVLLVLDDVGCLDQLDALLGNEAFHKGSKIIITTKDASLTERCALFDLPILPKHKKVSLNGLSKAKSLQLLCIHAFKSHKPEEAYKEATTKLVTYCQGHPLALEVLGRSLQKRDVVYWEECIKVLKKEPHSHVNKALKMSFDALLFENDKELFKHIACFFVGIDRDVTETILNSCDLNARYGITNLIERCLLSISWNNKLEMHSLVQEMGRDLVRQESPDRPWERSRLWCPEESFKVLEQKQGTRNIVGLSLDMRMLEKEKEKEKLSGSLQLKTEALSKMDKLKFLQLNYVKVNGSYENVSKELRWLSMRGFHFKSIPSELPLEKLVVLDMSYSKIESFDMSYNTSQRFASRLKGLIGSLKILDLSFCEQLCRVGGFFLLASLERLILRNCTCLIEVCESLEQCIELVHIDMSYCYKLRKLPKSLGKLKKVKTLLLDGCNSRESQIEIGNVKDIPCDSKFFLIFIPSSLRTLSLANNNLYNECFPMELKSLAMLKELRLDENPIVSMPSCVRTLPRLKRLYMNDCYKMKSIEYPPCMLRELYVFSSKSFKHDFEPSLKKIKFDPEMSPLHLSIEVEQLLSSFEIDGMVKIQGMENVEEKVLHSLGWTDLEFTNDMVLNYEFGIFSTFYPRKEMFEWIRCRSKGSSISFIIPSSHNNLRGMNFLCVVEKNPVVSFSSGSHFEIPLIKISNTTKNNTWIYKHYNNGMVDLNGCETYFEDDEEYHLSLLSHWMFGPNEMKAGDRITVNVANAYIFRSQIISECGIGFVYDDDDNDNGSGGGINEEDVLGYYKSWNHIIGGDLSHFQLNTGEYILDHRGFWRWFSTLTRLDYRPFIDDESKFKAEGRVRFKAFSTKEA